ncbi:polygalacturonase [Populus alba x Populus x berolinensis]|nr:polygalacturonase [Populus alba x Populus x berolinensis]
MHVSIFASNNLNLSDLHLSAPQDSPNTDGIKLSASEGIRVSHTISGTGDDCVAILNGTANVNITQVSCGPGHGISVGSMGGNTILKKKDILVGLTCCFWFYCTFANTSDDARIKTWESPHEGVASGFTYEDITMDGVQHPINIDQHYCPFPPCDTRTPSHIQIKEITYNNIRGNFQAKDCSFF